MRQSSYKPLDSHRMVHDTGSRLPVGLGCGSAWMAMQWPGQVLCPTRWSPTAARTGGACEALRGTPLVWR